jgi:hypothetical protein
VSQPLWLRVFNTVEGAVGPKVEELVHGEKFAATLALVNKVKGGVNGVVEVPTRRLWHLLNLPAGTDVKKLRGQIGYLDHEVRQLRSAVESAGRKQARRDRQVADQAAGERLKPGSEGGESRGD